MTKNTNDKNYGELRDAFYGEVFSEDDVEKMYNIIEPKLTKTNRDEIAALSQKRHDVTDHQKRITEINYVARDKFKDEFMCRGVSGNANAITEYVFRNEKIADLIDEKKASTNDMKIIKNTVLNSLAEILMAIENDEWIALDRIFSRTLNSDIEWKMPEPNMENFFKVAALKKY